MKISISVASAAIVAACLFSTGVSASPVREPVSVRVSHAGLDLSSTGGRAAFQRRVRSAIGTACAPRTPGLDALADAAQCRREMTDDATTKIAKVLGRDGTQLASTSTAR
ncbi:MAG TPA: UrcA family protein [Sphingomonas sp.]|nr:UrcA family protein [Sphingomonas sp.]